MSLRPPSRLSLNARSARQSLAALACLLRIGKGQDELALFGARWADDRLVMDKWFGLQIATAAPDRAAATALKLTRHPAFEWKNPNRFRSVVGALGANLGFAMALREGARAGVKLLPVWGNAISGAVAAAGTYGVGRAAIAFFIEGFSLEEARRFFTLRRKFPFLGA